MNKPHVQEMYTKEFIYSMQAKGLLPRLVTEASERRSKAYHETIGRIFPGPVGKDGVVERMLNDTTELLDRTSRGNKTEDNINALLQAQTHVAARGREEPSRRQLMQDKLQGLEKQLQSEREARIHMEDEATALRGTLATIRHRQAQQAAVRQLL